MNQEEHVRKAHQLSQRAQEETTNGGNEMVAAEFLWGAFARCLIGVALNLGLLPPQPRRLSGHITAP